ncbi:MAG: ATP-binding cassette domain-containing protein, partial [bacterium]|nr:ATP-binding cassette domain-containing protein [bacterium]
SYDNGKVEIIKNLDFVVPKKENGNLIAILGPSGCGKSTLLRFISGLDTPTSGSVLVNGKSAQDKANKVGQVFQKYSSYEWYSVLRNVQLGLEYRNSAFMENPIQFVKERLGKGESDYLSKSEREAHALEIIKKVGLEGHEHKFAQYPLLSGGQLQRVAIARSILANPSIMLMDEPFGALDVKTRNQMQKLTLDLFYEYKPTILFITHDISEAVYMADEIYVMGNAPAKFVKRIDVTAEIGYERPVEIKHTKKFYDVYNLVYDIMMSME